MNIDWGKTDPVFRVIWWFVLVGLLSWYLQGRLDSFNASEASIVDLVAFLVWMALLLAPLFKEVEVFGIKLRQELRSIKEELKHEISITKAELKSQITVQNASSSSLTANIGVPSDSTLLTRMEGTLNQLEKKFQEAEELGVHTEIESVPEPATTMFKVRFAMEKELRRLIAPYKSALPQRLSFRGYIDFLETREALDYGLASAARDMYAICTVGIHGESVSGMQEEYVTSVAPQLLAALRNIPSEQHPET